MERDLFVKIEQQMTKMSKGHKLIANYILSHYDKAAFMTAQKLGKSVGVSESTVVRFATMLGFPGYPEFQKALEELVRNKLNSVQRMEVTYGRIGQSEILENVLHSDIDKIKLTFDTIDQQAFEMAVDTIANARKIYVVGIRSCAPLANFLAYYLNLVCCDVSAYSATTKNELWSTTDNTRQKHRTKTRHSCIHYQYQYDRRILSEF